MTDTLPVIPVEMARRMVLNTQALCDAPTQPLTPQTLHATIRQLGYVQVDSINTIERAHHTILGTRFDAYRHDDLTHLLETDRQLFEHWTHDASVIPVEFFPQWKIRFERYRHSPRVQKWFEKKLKSESADVLDVVRDRIREEGPLMAKDFEYERPQKSGGWWDWKPQKVALEYLWRTGELSVAGRRNFHKVYDLTERVLPEQHQADEPTTEDWLDWKCENALKRLGAGTAKDIVEFWFSLKANEVTAWCKQAVADGRVVNVQVESVDGSPSRAAYALADYETCLAQLNPPPDRLRLLSPFDPLIRDRQRLKRLFNFDYRLEAFTPKAKREYGYYTLPMLWGEQLVGRIDPKLHRKTGVLEIQGIWWEQPKLAKNKACRKALQDSLEILAARIGAKQIAGV